MIRKEHIKAAKPATQTNSHHRASHVISKKAIYGQATDTEWPVEEEYFFEAEDY